MNETIKPLLSIRDLRKEFRGDSGRPSQALAGVDLELYPGETLGVVGESGCGKTTLARCALRLLEFDSGSVFFDGIDLSQLPAAALRTRRREFQMIFQDSAASLDPRKTVGEILEEPFAIHGLGSRRDREIWIRDLLSAVALESSLIRRKPLSLSGGQQQRVGIARALALSPRLLIADEPVSALDASVQAQILNLLVDVQNRFKLTLMLISHSLAVVHYLCTRVVVMYSGRIIEEAPGDVFFRRPLHPYSRMLLDNVPSIGSVADRSGAEPVGVSLMEACPREGCPYRSRCPEAGPRCGRQVPAFEQVGADAKVACFMYTVR